MITVDYTPPAGLSKQAQAIWRGVVPRRAKTSERMILIKTALQTLDRADEITAEIKKQGLTIENPSSGAIRANPLVKLEKELRGQFAAMWDRMALDWDAVIDGGNGPIVGPGCGSDEIQSERQREFDDATAYNAAAVEEFLKVNNDA